MTERETGTRLVEKIVRRDNQWCVVSEDGSRSFGCFATEAEAKRRLAQIEFFKRQKESLGETLIPTDWFRGKCDPCYEQLKAKGWKGVKVGALIEALAKLDEQQLGDVNVAGLCDKFGDPEGFRTRCMADPPPNIDDPAAFCNALKIACHGSAAAESVSGNDEEKAPAPARESFQTAALLRLELVESDSGPEGREWDVVVIEEGLSLNGTFYPAMTLAKAAKLFEGARVNAFELKRGVFDHLPNPIKDAIPGGLAKNLVGWLENPRVVERNGKTAIVARFKVAESAEWLRKLLIQQFREGRNLLGFSIDAVGTAVWAVENGKPVKKILSIEAVDSVDVVTNPAAGGRFERLVASSITQGERAMNSNTKWHRRVLETLSERFPSWLEGHAFITPDATDEEAARAVLRLFEAHRDAAVSNLISLKDPAQYVPAARGVAHLQRLVELAREAKGDEIVLILEAWHAAGGERERYLYGKGKPSFEQPDRLEAIAQELTEERVEAALAGSNLPDVSKERVRAMFKGRTASREEVREAIRREQDYIASLKPTTPAGSSGPRAQVTLDQKDAWKRAMTAMLVGNPGMLSKYPEFRGVRPFASLHESYRVVMGVGGSALDVGERIMRAMLLSLPPMGVKPSHEEELAEHHKRIRESFGSFPLQLRETLLTTDWAEVFGDSIRRALIMFYQLEPLTAWRRVVSSIVPLPDFRVNRRIRIGGFADLPIVAQDALYTEQANPPDEEVTYPAQKRGNLWTYSMETIVNDDLGAIRQAPMRLGIAAARTLDKFVRQTLIAANPTVDYDGLALFHAAHGNLGSTALSAAALEAAITAMRKQTELGSGERLVQIQPRILMVPPDLEALAFELTSSRVKVTATADATIPNFVAQQRIEALVNPWQTDTNNWQLIADPTMSPTVEIGFLGGREEPELFIQDAPTVGNVFDRDRVSLKIRHIYGGDVLDHRSFFGAIVP